MHIIPFYGIIAKKIKERDDLSMKQRLSIEDVTALSAKQQESLRSIWTPERYDIAVSHLCTNAEMDEYKWLEFAIGDITVMKTGILLLKDLRLTDGYVKISEGEHHGAEQLELQEPTAFFKTDVLPLLSIGQLITMLHILDKSNYHFYLLSGNKQYACEIGDFNSNIKSALLSKPDKYDEIIDVLWTTFKTIL